MTQGGDGWASEAAGFAARADVLNDWESHDHVTVWSGGFLLITTFFFSLHFYYILVFRGLEFFC
jgi:hypothetical protein